MLVKSLSSGDIEGETDRFLKIRSKLRVLLTTISILIMAVPVYFIAVSALQFDDCEG